MKRPLAILFSSSVVLMAALARLQAQCCLGARNFEVESRGGEYRVEATSQTGTGIDFHGPYHYRFRFLKRAAGDRYDEESSFDLKWDTREHFGMELFVSPTGNGFAMEFPSERLSFYAKDGRKIFDAEPGHPVELSDDGYSVILCRRVRMRDGGSWYVEDSRVFLPLGAPVTNQLTDQVAWLLQLDEKQVDGAVRDIGAYLHDLNSPDPGLRERGRRGLVSCAFLSIRPLQQALAQAADGVHRERLREVSLALRGWEDRAEPGSWHDLSLLLSLRFYPDSLIRRRAGWCVVSLLSPVLKKRCERDGVLVEELLEQTLEWVRENQSRLRWDAEKSAFVLSEGG